MTKVDKYAILRRLPKVALRRIDPVKCDAWEGGTIRACPLGQALGMEKSQDGGYPRAERVAHLLLDEHPRWGKGIPYATLRAEAQAFLHAWDGQQDMTRNGLSHVLKRLLAR